MGVASAVTDDEATCMAKKLKTKDRKKLSKKSSRCPASANTRSPIRRTPATHWLGSLKTAPRLSRRK